MNFTHQFFKQIMWRSSKAHVSDELQLPPQEELVTWLTFSPVEEHFYQKQHSTCLVHAHDIIKSLKERRKESSGSAKVGDVYLTHNEIARLLGPLLKLRQACCHPQVGSSGLCSLQRSPLSMEEILNVSIMFSFIYIYFSNLPFCRYNIFEYLDSTLTRSLDDLQKTPNF